MTSHTNEVKMLHQIINHQKEEITGLKMDIADNPKWMETALKIQKENHTLRCEVEKLNEECMSMCKQLEDATKHIIEDPTRFYRGIKAVEELVEEPVMEETTEEISSDE